MSSNPFFPPPSMVGYVEDKRSLWRHKPPQSWAIRKYRIRRLERLQTRHCSHNSSESMLRSIVDGLSGSLIVGAAIGFFYVACAWEYYFISSIYSSFEEYP